MKSALCFILVSLFFISGCSRDAQHVPPVWQLPYALASNSIQNSAYNKRRNNVKRYVIANYDNLKNDVKVADGSYLEEVLRLAQVSEKNITTAKRQLQENYSGTFENIDIISDFLTSHYTSLYIETLTKHEKKINGFSYTQVRNFIVDFIQHDFDGFRRAVKQNNRQYMQGLIANLNLQNNEKKNDFLDNLFDQYDRFFIEPVVVGVMVVK